MSTRKSASNAPDRTRMWKRLRLAVSTGLIVFLLAFKVPFGEVRNLILGSNPTYIVLAFVVILVGVVVSAYKWQILLSSLSIYVPLSRLIKIYLVGTFFNNFLPGSVGGDVARTIITARATGMNMVVAASVLTERATGLVALLCYAMLGWGCVIIAQGGAIIPRSNVPIWSIGVVV
ncbi:MAG: lysylphosphatidylglycerol synthase transmembrane domain-containing protein, partial [Candidatus Methanomethyliaceae archaeon]